MGLTNTAYAETFPVDRIDATGRTHTARRALWRVNSGHRQSASIHRQYEIGEG